MLSDALKSVMHKAKSRERKSRVRARAKAKARASRFWGHVRFIVVVVVVYCCCYWCCCCFGIQDKPPCVTSRKRDRYCKAKKRRRATTTTTQKRVVLVGRKMCKATATNKDECGEMGWPKHGESCNVICKTNAIDQSAMETARTRERAKERKSEYITMWPIFHYFTQPIRYNSRNWPGPPLTPPALHKCEKCRAVILWISDTEMSYR